MEFEQNQEEYREKIELKLKLKAETKRNRDLILKDSFQVINFSKINFLLPKFYKDLE